MNAILITFGLLFSFNQSSAQQSYGISTCSGILIDFKQPGFIAGETYTWTAPIISPAGAITGGVGLAGQTSVAQTLVNVTNTIAATATYNVTSSQGINFQLVVTVNPVPVVSNVLSTICSGAAFNVVPSNVPANTTYTWTTPVVSPAGTVTGSSAQTVPQIFIGQTLTNPTVAKSTIIYTVTPTAGACSGNPFLITVTDNPIPVLNNSSSSPIAICSGSSYSFNPTTSTSGTTITWSRSAVSGISNTANQGNSNPNEVLNNTTTAAITVNYVFKLSANSCTNDQSISLIVNPKPALTSSLSPPAICSGSFFTYSPAAINTTNPTYAWTRAGVTGINGTVAGSGTNDPNESLVNSTLNSLQVTYSYLVTDGSTSCVSSAQLVRVLVNPVPNITNVSVSSCSGNVFTTPVSGAITGTLYTWAAPVPVSGGAITGGSAVSVGQYFIGQALSNNGTQGVVDYTVTPNANGCVGSNFKVTVTVTSAGTTAQLNNLAPPSICTGTTFNYPPASSSAVTSYTWTRYQTNGITPSTNNGTGTILELLTNTSTVPLVANYAYTLATADGCTNTQLVPVTVNPIATLNSSLSPLPICSNTTFSYAPSSATAKTTFSWTRAAVTGISNSPASGTGNPNEILVNTTTSPINVTYTFTLSPPSGCVSTQNVVITVNPSPVLTSSLTPPAICSGAIFTYPPTSSTSGMTFNWSRSAVTSISNGAGTGVGNPAEILVNTSNSPVTVTYAYSLSANGCTNIQNVNVIVNPTPNIANLTAASCSNTLFTVTPPNVPAGTQYTWTSPVVSPASSITGGSLVNTLQNSVSQTLINATSNPATATYTVTPVANGCTGTVFTLDVTVNNLPLLTSSATPPAICSNRAFNYTPTSALAGTSFAWTRAAVSGISNGTSNGINNPNENLINTTTSTVPVIYQYILTSSAGCVSPVQNVTVQINAAASLTSSLTPPAICSGAPFNYTPLSGTAGTVFTWTRDIQTSFSNGASSGTGNPAEILINTGTTPASVSYVYTLTANGCTNTQVVSVLVNPTPVVPAQLASICGGNAFSINPTGVPAGTQYTWTAPVVNPSLSILGSSAQAVLQNSVSQTLSNITNNIATATYTVVPTANGCSGGSFNIVVTVNPSPVLTSNTSPSAVCSNALFTYNPVSTISGTTFAWTRAAVTGISNGVANGINNPNETLVNKTTSAVSVIYQYVLTSPSGCVSSVQNVTVQVNPAPVLSSNPTPPAICSGLTFNYTPLSATTGTLFTWTRDVQTSINNTTSSGSGNPAEILINTGTTAANVTYIYTLTANGCSNTQNVTVVVNATPVIPAQLSSVCTGNAFAVNPAGVPSGTQYTWTAPVINPALSISGSSSQAVLQSVIGQTLTNNTNSLATATYTVTPSANGCTGNSFNLAVTVNPAPVLTSNAAPAAVCSNAVFNYTPTSNVTGGSYTWSRAVVNGISNVASSGTNTINETLVNTSATAVTVLYSYVVTSPSGCISAPQTVAVIVNPSPVLSSSLSPAAICSGGTFNYTPITSSGAASFAWSRATQTSINNPATSGTGNPAEVLVNTSTGIVQVSYVYAITLNGCTNTQTVNVNVNPVASLSTQVSTICSGTAFTVKPQGAPVGTQYTWGAPVINPALSLTGGSAVTILQNNISQTLTNSSVSDATAVYTVTPSTNGCSGSSFTVAITVNPLPVLSSSQTPVAICSNTAFNYTPTSSFAGTAFLWTRAAVAGISNPSASGNGNPNETLINITGSAVSVVYSYALTTPNGCINTQSVTVQVNPLPVLNNTTPGAICSGATFNYTPATNSGNAGFSWTRAAQPSINNPGASGTGNPAEILVNTSTGIVQVSYAYAITLNGCTNTQTVNVNVNPVASLSTQVSTICSGTAFTVKPQGAPVGTQYTWGTPVINPALSLTGGSAVTILQNNISQTLANSSVSDATAVYTVTPSTNGCTGATFTVAITVNPIPVLSSSQTPVAICSNTSFNYTPTSAFPGTAFLWTRAAVAGISNPSASGNGNPNETLINITGSAVSVVYSYALTTPNGCINTQSVTVSVNPIPVLNNTTPAAICSGAIFNYSPVSSITGSGFSWSRLQNNFISNPATSGTGNPSEVLVNTSTNTVNVTYTYTITSPIGCVNTQSIILPVNPAPIIGNMNVVTCNNTLFTVSPSNVPAGTLYTWSLPSYNPVGSVTGGTSQSVGQTNIVQTLVNQTLNPAVATYTVVPTFNGCTGSSFSVAVTVNNTTILSSSLVAPAVCSNAVFNYTPASNTTGTSFTWTRSVVNGISNPASSGTGNPGEALINITTQPIQVSYNYTLNTTNGCFNTQTITVLVNPIPVLSSTLAPAAICSGSAFNYTPTSVFAGASYSWSRSVMPFISNGAGSGSGIINPSEVLVNTTINPVTVPYNYIITSNGCSNNQTVNIIVNPTPNVANQVATICGSTSFTVNPVTVPVGTQYTWTAPAINPTGSVNGGAAQTVLQNTITQLLTNQTLSTGIATYTVTPVANGCTGVNFSVAVSVKPTPVIPNQQIAAVCSGTSFSFASNNVPVGGTSYSWSSPVISPQGSLTGGSGQSLLQSAVSQTLSSTNNLTNTATYSVVPVTAGCVGNTFSLTVPVNPVPVVADLVDTICSGGTFSLVPGPVPANTIYTWSVPTSLPNGSLIGGKAQTTGVSVISQSLQITGNSISQALYSISPSALGCVGNPFNLVETVGAPLAAIKNSTALICSGTSFDLTPLTVPANTTYTWATPIDNPFAAASGYSAQNSRQTKISQTLTNLISKPVTVVYSVVPFNTGCTGATFTASVTVSPVPKSAITGKQVVCRDPFDTLTVNFVGTPPWSFSYVDNGVAKNVTGISSSPFTWILPSLPVAPTRTVQITLVNDRACVDSVDTAVFVQKVNPLPVGQIVSLHGNYICNNIADTLFVSNPTSDTLRYQWTRNGITLSGANTDSIATLSAGYYNAVLTNQFGCVDTASPPVTLIVIAQPKINFIYDAYCINTPIHFTNITDTTLIGQTRWTWDLGDSTTANSYHTVNSYVKAGNRHIRLTATQLYCQAYNTSFDSTINIEFPINGIRLPSVSAYKGVFTPISDRAIPTYKYLWTPTRGIDFPDRPSVNFNFQTTQEYLINLTSPAGCITTDSVLVRVFDDKLVDMMVPKSFTPNGDGTNDVLFTYLAGIKTFQYFKVYNRQGKLMFETTNPDVGWNGNYNGSPMPMGIYIWTTAGIALDGSTVQKTGQTILMR